VNLYYLDFFFFIVCFSVVTLFRRIPSLFCVHNFLSKADLSVPLSKLIILFILIKSKKCNALHLFVSSKSKVIHDVWFNIWFIVV